MRGRCLSDFRGNGGCVSSSQSYFSESVPIFPCPRLGGDPPMQFSGTSWKPGVSISSPIMGEYQSGSQDKGQMALS